MCVKQTIITANINEEETVLHIYPMLLFCFFFVHPICKLFCPQKLAGIHIIHSQNNRLILLNSNFHALQKQAKRYLMQVYSFLEFYICLNESIMFVIYYTFDVLLYCCGDFCFGYIYDSTLANVYIWDILYSHKCCLSWDDPWGAQNTDPCWPVCTLPNSHLLAMAATIL